MNSRRKFAAPLLQLGGVTAKAFSPLLSLSSSLSHSECQGPSIPHTVVILTSIAEQTWDRKQQFDRSHETYGFHTSDDSGPNLADSVAAHRAKMGS